MLTNEEKLKIRLSKTPDEEIDYDRDFMEIGFIIHAGLIDENLKLTVSGEKRIKQIIDGRPPDKADLLDMYLK
jgi:hypothetical protein